MDTHISKVRKQVPILKIDEFSASGATKLEETKKSIKNIVLTIFLMLSIRLSYRPFHFISY